MTNTITLCISVVEFFFGLALHKADELLRLRHSVITLLERNGLKPIKPVSQNFITGGPGDVARKQTTNQ